MIRNLTAAAAASVPLTAITDFTQYLVQDWEFAKWIAVLVGVDTILGIWKHLMKSDVSSEDFWGGFTKKIIVYLILMILSNVLANYTIEGQSVGTTEWMSKYLCIFMVVRETISILENINAVYPILPKKLLKRFKDFGNDGEYIKDKEEL